MIAAILIANVNVDGKHLRQITKINIQQRLPIVHCGNSVMLWKNISKEMEFL